jgi:hypothetical protein
MAAPLSDCYVLELLCVCVCGLKALKWLKLIGEV